MYTKIKQALKSTIIYDVYIAYAKKRHERKLAGLFKEDFLAFKKSESLSAIRFSSEFEHYPIMEDKIDLTPIEPHYTYHPAWAARILAKTNPVKHVDISSILHFSTLVSALIPVDFYDYRPAQVKLDNLNSGHADLTKLPFADNSINSLSCMHTLEHIGLGRYGDPINYDGDLLAAKELTRVLAVGGNLLIVTPVGKPKIAFNAHRIYAYEQVISMFSTLSLVEFSLIPDNFLETGIIYHADPETSKAQNWGCGCFWLKKIA